MSPTRRSFENRFLSKIGKIDPRRIREYVARLVSQKNFFERIFERLDEAIIVTDAELRVLYANPVSLRMLQQSPRKRPLGENLLSLCPEGGLHEILVAMQERPRAIDHYECALGAAGGRRVTVTTLPLRAEGTDIRLSDLEDEQIGSTSDKEPIEETMWVFLIHDVTEHYHSIEEHSRAQQLASLALLTSGIAHEIKNPLNSLNIHAQILESAAEGGEGHMVDPEQVRRAAQVILEETDRLTAIVNEFIQAARPQSPVLDRQPLAPIIDDLVRLFSHECEQEGIELTSDVDADLPPLELDRHLIFQALRNLVKNAIEAHTHLTGTEEEPVVSAASPEISVRARLVGDSVAIEVADNGPGIAEDDLPRLFDPYFTTKFGGTGLGLMVVYRIVAQHRGSIHVDSRRGEGARFVIRLPLAERL